MGQLFQQPWTRNFADLVIEHKRFAEVRFLGCSYPTDKMASSSNPWHRRLKRMYEDEQVLHMLHASTVADEEEKPHVHRGSVPGRRIIHRDRSSGYARLVEDYFADIPMYNDDIFRRR